MPSLVRPQPLGPTVNRTSRPDGQQFTSIESNNLYFFIAFSTSLLEPKSKSTTNNQQQVQVNNQQQVQVNNQQQVQVNNQQQVQVNNQQQVQVNKQGLVYLCKWCLSCHDLNLPARGSTIQDEQRLVSAGAPCSTIHNRRERLEACKQVKKEGLACLTVIG